MKGIKTYWNKAGAPLRLGGIAVLLAVAGHIPFWLAFYFGIGSVISTFTFCVYAGIDAPLAIVLVAIICAIYRTFRHKTLPTLAELGALMLLFIVIAWAVAVPCD